MACKFKYGDEVRTTNSRHEGTVVSVRLVSGTYMVKVKFKNRFILPPEMEEPEHIWELINKASKDCPTCGTKWTITKFGQNVWKDCSKCDRKEEDILAMKNEKKGSKLNVDFTGKTKPPGAYTNGNKDPAWTKEEDDLLKEFEKMLGSDDDQDDFGLFQP